MIFIRSLHEQLEGGGSFYHSEVNDRDNTGAPIDSASLADHPRSSFVVLTYVEVVYKSVSLKFKLQFNELSKRTPQGQYHIGRFSTNEIDDWEHSKKKLKEVSPEKNRIGCCTHMPSHIPNVHLAVIKNERTRRLRFFYAIVM